MALTRPKYSSIYDTDWKQSCDLATTIDVGDLFAGNAQTNTVDGVTVAVGNRILVKDQANTTQNGIYSVRVVGSGANGWWTRSLDANQNGFVTSGLVASIEGGSANGGRTYKLITQNPIYLGNTGLSFQISTASSGGANTQVQFNDNNALNGSAYFTWNKYSNVLTIGGNILAAGNVTAQYILGSGQFLTGLPAGYSNVNVKAYTESMGFQNYGNANVTAYTVTMGFTNFSNVNVVAYTQTQSYTNYSNVNLAAYLGGAVTVGGNLTVQGNLIVLGNLTSLNIETINTTEYISSTGNLVINNAAPSISTTTGVIVAQGGMGLGGNLNLGGNIVAGGNITAPYYFGNGSQLSALPGYAYSNVNVIAYLGSGSNITVGGNLNVTGNVYSNSGTDPLGYIYTMDDLSSQFDGQSRSFTISINDGTVYSVNNPNQISLQIGGVTVAPTRYIRDYQNLTEVSVFNRGFYLQTGSVAANASIITGNNFSTGGNTIVFATAPSVGMSFYGTVRTNSDPVAAFTFKQSPFTALNIMLGS